MRILGVNGTVELCTGGSNPGPAHCASALQGKVSAVRRIDLCKGAVDNVPAKCFKDSKKALQNDDDLTVSLCKGAGSDVVVECVLKAPFTMEPKDKAELCNGATSTKPAECAEFMWNGNTRVAAGTVDDVMNSGKVVKLCKGVESVTPAMCYLQAPRELDKGNRERLCEGETNVYRGTKDKKGRGGGEQAVAAMCAREVRERWMERNDSKNTVPPSYITNESSTRPLTHRRGLNITSTTALYPGFAGHTSRWTRRSWFMAPSCAPSPRLSTSHQARFWIYAPARPTGFPARALRRSTTPSATT